MISTLSVATWLCGCCGFALLLCGALKRAWARALCVLGGVGAALTVILSVATLASPHAWPSGHVDTSAAVAQMVVAAAAVVALMTLLALWLRTPPLASEAFVPGLVLIVSAFLMVAAAATDLPTLLVAVEGSSLGMIAWIGLDPRGGRSTEIAVKTFVVGMAAVGLITFGGALMYVGSGVLTFDAYERQLREQGPDAVATLGALMVLSGLLYRLGAAPFHLTGPDTVEGAPLPAAVFVIAGQRTCLAVVVARLCRHVFFHPALTADGSGVAAALSFIAGASVLMGTLGAVRQDSVKRMFGYLSVAQVGWALAALAAASQRVAGASVVFGSAVLAGPLGLVSALLIMPYVPPATEGRSYLTDWIGFAHRRPTLAACMAVILVSLSGLPVTVGFIAILGLLKVTFASRWLLPLAGATVVSLPIGFYAALRLMVTMYFRDLAPANPADQAKAETNGRLLPIALVLAVCVPSVVLFGIFNDPFVALAARLLPGAAAK